MARTDTRASVDRFVSVDLGADDGEEPGGKKRQPDSGGEQEPDSGGEQKPDSDEDTPDQRQDIQSFVADFLREEHGGNAVTTDVRGADPAVDSGLVRFRVTVVSSGRKAVETVRQRLDDTRRSLPVVIFPSDHPVTYVERGFGLVGIPQ